MLNCLNCQVNMINKHQLLFKLLRLKLKQLLQQELQLWETDLINICKISTVMSDKSFKMFNKINNLPYTNTESYPNNGKLISDNLSSQTSTAFIQDTIFNMDYVPFKQLEEKSLIVKQAILSINSNLHHALTSKELSQNHNADHHSIGKDSTAQMDSFMLHQELLAHNADNDFIIILFYQIFNKFSF